jgi:hypothetical protein
MQMKNEGYKDAVSKKLPHNKSESYKDGYFAGAAELDLFREHNQHSTQEAFRYVFTRIRAHIRNVGVCYVYLMPNKKVLCKSSELSEAKMPKDGCLIGVYTDDHPTIALKFADVKDDIIEAMLEVFNAS